MCRSGVVSADDIAIDFPSADSLGTSSAEDSDTDAPVGSANDVLVSTETPLATVFFSSSERSEDTDGVLGAASDWVVVLSADAGIGGIGSGAGCEKRSKSPEE